MNAERVRIETEESSERTPSEKEAALQVSGMAKYAGGLTPEEVAKYIERRLNPSYHVGDHLVLAGILPPGARREKLLSHFAPLKPDNTPKADTANTGSDHGSRMRLLRQNRT